MKSNKILMTFLLVMSILFTQSAFARLQKDARECIKPRFSKFTPGNKSEVAPGSTISFITNYSTNKYTIRIKAKGITVDRKAIRITDKNSFYRVEFELPATLVDTYARINIKAKAKVGPSRCVGKDGWLLKVMPDQTVTATEQDVEPLATPAVETPKAPVSSAE